MRYIQHINISYGSDVPVPVNLQLFGFTSRPVPMSFISILEIGVYHFFKEIRLIISWRIEYTLCDNELKEDLHHG